MSLTGAFAQADAVPEDTIYGFAGGFAVSFSGFRLATGLVWDDLQGNGGEGWAVDGQLAYSAGDWQFSLNGLHSKDDDSGDKLLAGSFNTIYTVTSGVILFGANYLGKEDLGAGGSNDIVSVTSGLKLSF